MSIQNPASASASDQSNESEASDATLHPTTTHAANGAGRPRLVFNVGDDFALGDAREEFALSKDTVTIGSSERADLVLAGLLPEHAEIRHNERDEYVLFAFGPSELSSGTHDTTECPGHVLRDASRVKLGDWSMFFARDEFADHGRPFGGRQGGEGAHQRRQPDRPQDHEAD